VSEGEDGSPGGGQRGRLVGALLIGSIVAGAVIAAFAFGRRPPELPPDLVHRASMGSPVPAACLNCHSRSGPVPPPPTHTGRQDCENCHSLPEG
jgi:hypothetical protein